MIIGIGTSGIDIAWDLVDCARTVYLIGKDKIDGPDQHSRQRQLQRHLIPPKAVHLCEIRRLHQPSSSRIEDGVIELTSGERLTGISSIIFASGWVQRLSLSVSSIRLFVDDIPSGTNTPSPSSAIFIWIAEALRHPRRSSPPGKACKIFIEMFSTSQIRH